MLQLKNGSPFQATMMVFPNEQGIDTLYVVVKATFDIGAALEVAEVQYPVQLADGYWGEPGQSSVKYASEAHLTKPGTDIVVIGSACAPDRKAVTQLDVTVAVAGRRKTVRVFGDRRWTKGWLGWGITAPAPFQQMPLQYERAFGGVHVVNAGTQEVVYEARNPVGCGFVGRRSKQEIEGLSLPNLEDPAQLIKAPTDQPKPAGFGSIAASWEPRKSYAGTYDERWQKNRAPYLPVDFNPKFFHHAHPDLVCSHYLKGGEMVEIVNASSRGRLAFRLPTCQLEIKVRVAGKTEKPVMNLETVLIDTGASHLVLTWRAAVPCDKKVLKVEEVEVGVQKLDVQRKVA